MLWHQTEMNMKGRELGLKRIKWTFWVNGNLQSGQLIELALLNERMVRDPNTQLERKQPLFIVIGMGPFKFFKVAWFLECLRAFAKEWCELGRCLSPIKKQPVGWYTQWAQSTKLCAVQSGLLGVRLRPRQMCALLFFVVNPGLHRIFKQAGYPRSADLRWI